ncbi:MAG: Nif3-like dinuclear metal center hexameric protein [Flavobacteriales bacterium]|jgi:dinuclear metal center YbgI/SA1388 family protein|nr:Nif3-like dinuclear metal center hexameric protein [Flavobacteriales bacterium]MBT5090428.1 Nif3-like dinuclear metal center hexameric protein [Flavobacteriales bacterium]MBT5750906.1 Nif3-like dinuclear metal center hexameric protein [Flavobacteriales bacterium]
MKIKQVASFLESIAPFEYQESYDNCGLIIGDTNAEVKGALITLDCTEAIIDEAISTGCNLVIAHHPIIFSGLKKLNGSNYIESTVIKAIKNEIAIYAIHTNLDNVHNGVNAKIAEKLGLVNCKVLLPRKDLNTNIIGSGIIGELNVPVDAQVFLKNLKLNMQTDCVRYTPLVKQQIKTVAVCGGSGSFLLKNAITAKADVFITADFKYHEFFDAENKIIIADIGHYESEQFTKDLIYDLLVKNFIKFAVRLSKVNTNPIKYL